MTGFQIRLISDASNVCFIFMIDLPFNRLRFYRAAPEMFRAAMCLNLQNVTQSLASFLNFPASIFQVHAYNL